MTRAHCTDYTVDDPINCCAMAAGLVILYTEYAHAPPRSDISNRMLMRMSSNTNSSLTVMSDKSAKL